MQIRGCSSLLSLQSLSAAAMIAHLAPECNACVVSSVNPKARTTCANKLPKVLVIQSGVTCMAISVILMWDSFPVSGVNSRWGKSTASMIVALPFTDCGRKFLCKWALKSTGRSSYWQSRKCWAECGKQETPGREAQRNRFHGWQGIWFNWEAPHQISRTHILFCFVLFFMDSCFLGHTLLTTPSLDSSKERESTDPTLKSSKIKCKVRVF